MNTLLNKSIKIPLRHILLIILIILVIVTAVAFFQSTNPKLTTIIGGICGGLIVYLITFFFSWYEYKNIDRFRALGVKDILSNRKNSDYYKVLVSNAKERIQVIGSSCTRFIDDFANQNSDDHALLDSIQRNPDLSIRILIPDDEHIDRKSKEKIELHKETIEELLRKHSHNIEIRRFDFEPRYSFVQADTDIIVGPVFKDTESKESPAIHLVTDCNYAQKYLTDFKNTWEGSKPFE